MIKHFFCIFLVALQIGTPSAYGLRSMNAAESDFALQPLAQSLDIGQTPLGSNAGLEEVRWAYTILPRLEIPEAPTSSGTSRSLLQFSRRRILQIGVASGIALPLARHAQAQKPTKPALDPKQFDAEKWAKELPGIALNEEQNGLFTLPGGTAQSEVVVAINALNGKQREALLRAFLGNTPALYHNTLFDDLFQSRNIVSFALGKRDLMDGRPSTQVRNPDAFIQTIYKAIQNAESRYFPRVITAIFLMTRKDMRNYPEVEVTQDPNKHTKSLAATDAETQAFLNSLYGDQLGQLNNALKAAGRPQITAKELLNETSWRVATELQSEARQSIVVEPITETERNQGAAILQRLQAHSAEVQLRIAEAGFKAPSQAVVDKLVLARFVMDEIDVATMDFEDDRLIGRREAQQAFAALKEKPLDKDALGNALRLADSPARSAVVLDILQNALAAAPEATALPVAAVLAAHPNANLRRLGETQVQAILDPKQPVQDRIKLITGLLNARQDLFGTHTLPVVFIPLLQRTILDYFDRWEDKFLTPNRDMTAAFAALYQATRRAPQATYEASRDWLHNHWKSERNGRFARGYTRGFWALLVFEREPKRKPEVIKLIQDQKGALSTNQVMQATIRVPAEVRYAFYEEVVLAQSDEALRYGLTPFLQNALRDKKKRAAQKPKRDTPREKTVLGIRFTFDDAITDATIASIPDIRLRSIASNIKARHKEFQANSVPNHVSISGDRRDIHGSISALTTQLGTHNTISLGLGAVLAGGIDSILDHEIGHALQRDGNWRTTHSPVEDPLWYGIWLNTQTLTVEPETSMSRFTRTAFFKAWTDNSYYPFSPSMLRWGYGSGHPHDNNRELFASSATLLGNLTFRQRVVSNLHFLRSLHPKTTRAAYKHSLLVWSYMRDRIHIGPDGFAQKNDAFAWFRSTDHFKLTTKASAEDPGLEAAPEILGKATAATSFTGLFHMGTARLAREQDWLFLNTDVGQKQTTHIRLNLTTAALPQQLPRIFVQAGTPVPSSWQGARTQQIAASPLEAQAQLRSQAKPGDIILLQPAQTPETRASWSTFLSQEQLYGLVITTRTLSTLNRLTPPEIALFLTYLDPGLTLDLLMRDQPGQQDLFIWA